MTNESLASGHLATLEIAPEILDWLLDGDPAVRWQVHQDLLRSSPETVRAERARVAKEGWGAALLTEQDPEGTWAGKLYSPKWISTTYTMLLLWRLGLPADHAQAHRACRMLLELGFNHDGGINVHATYNHSETCVTGMVLSILSHFRYADERVDELARHLLGQQMPDGGWNCQSYQGDTHSSFHTTISVLEGLWEYEQHQPENLLEIQEAQRLGRAFLLAHQLYRSDRTGQVVHPPMTRFSFPPRWRYDVLRALDYFQRSGAGRDERLEDPIDLLNRKRKKDGRWVLQNRHPGRTYFEMERVGQPSRWNTLRALRVLKWWHKE